MKRLFKSKSGMSLLEVMIALALLGVLTVPIMTAFMNTQLYAKKVDKQTDINAITRTVKQIVIDGMLSNDSLLDINGDPVDTLDQIGTPDKFKDIIVNGKDTGNPITTPFLKIDQIVNGSIEKSEKYKYKIEYLHNECYDRTYPKVYHVVIKICNYDNDNLLNEIKVAVMLDI